LRKDVKMIYARKKITTLLPFRKFFSIFGNLIGEPESDGLPANDCDDYSADEDHVDIHQVTRLLEGDAVNFKPVPRTCYAHAH